MPVHFFTELYKTSERIELTYEIVMIMMDLLTCMVSRF